MRPTLRLEDKQKPGVIWVDYFRTTPKVTIIIWNYNKIIPINNESGLCTLLAYIQNQWMKETFLPKTSWKIVAGMAWGAMAKMIIRSALNRAKGAPIYFDPSSRRKAGFRLGTAIEQGHLPSAGVYIMAYDINCAVAAPHFEITAVRIKPTIEHFVYFNQTLPEIKTQWRLLASVPGIAFYFNGEWICLAHCSSLRFVIFIVCYYVLSNSDIT